LKGNQKQLTGLAKGFSPKKRKAFLIPHQAAASRANWENAVITAS
jgi:hypothetical protein